MQLVFINFQWVKQARGKIQGGKKWFNGNGWKWLVTEEFCTFFLKIILSEKCLMFMTSTQKVHGNSDNCSEGCMMSVHKNGWLTFLLRRMFNIYDICSESISKYFKSLKYFLLNCKKIDWYNLDICWQFFFVLLVQLSC